MKVLYLYDRNKKLAPLPVSHHYNYTITKEINVLDSIEFNIDFHEDCVQYIECEGYLRTEDGFFVIKERNIDEEGKVTVYASLEVEGLKGVTHKSFEHDVKLTSMVNYALTDTAWTANYINAEGEKWTPSDTAHSIKLNYSTVYAELQQIMSTFNVEMRFDNINKVVNIYPSGGIGSNRGAYFFENLNLSKFAVDSNSEEFATKIRAYGKDVNVTLEDYSYSDKKVTYIWNDTRYTKESTLKSAAQKKLNELCKPKTTYTLTIADLQEAEPKSRNVFDFSLGDTILISAKGIKAQQRIVKMVQNADVPESTVIELSNATKHLQSSLATNNILLNDIVNNYTGGSSGGGEGGTAVALTISEVNYISESALGV